jgi:hypothetical protein
MLKNYEYTVHDEEAFEVESQLKNVLNEYMKLLKKNRDLKSKTETPLLNRETNATVKMYASSKNVEITDQVQKVSDPGDNLKQKFTLEDQNAKTSLLSKSIADETLKKFTPVEQEIKEAVSNNSDEDENDEIKWEDHYAFYETRRTTVIRPANFNEGYFRSFKISVHSLAEPFNNQITDIEDLGDSSTFKDNQNLSNIEKSTVNGEDLMSQKTFTNLKNSESSLQRDPSVHHGSQTSLAKISNQSFKTEVEKNPSFNETNSKNFSINKNTNFSEKPILSDHSFQKKISPERKTINQLDSEDTKSNAFFKDSLLQQSNTKITDVHQQTSKTSELPDHLSIGDPHFHSSIKSKTTSLFAKNNKDEENLSDGIEIQKNVSLQSKLSDQLLINQSITDKLPSQKSGSLIASSHHDARENESSLRGNSKEGSNLLSRNSTRLQQLHANSSSNHSHSFINEQCFSIPHQESNSNQNADNLANSAYERKRTESRRNTQTATPEDNLYDYLEKRVSISSSNCKVDPSHLVITQPPRKKTESIFGKRPKIEPSSQGDALDFSFNYTEKDPVKRAIYLKQYSPNKKLTLLQLKDFAEEFYAAKFEYDSNNIGVQTPKETAEEFLCMYLKQKYGLNELVQEWAFTIVDGLKKFSNHDVDLAIFFHVR